ncbi:MAG: hypothetical protein WAV09_00640 [Minisyncoccia bacterium]
MEARETFLYFNYLVIAMSASVSLVITLTYIPLKILPAVLKASGSIFFQKLYMVLVLSLFTSLIGFGLYGVISYNLLRTYDLNEMIRAGVFVGYLTSLFVLTLSFKKQTLTSFKIVAHSILGASVIGIATQENTLNFFNYLYALLILGLCFALRYGVLTFSKKLSV